MIEVDKDIESARAAFVETVTNGVVAYLRKQGITLTDRGETDLSDIIRFNTTP